MSLCRFFQYGSVDLAFLCVVITHNFITHSFLSDENRFVRLTFRYFNAFRTKVNKTN